MRRLARPWILENVRSTTTLRPFAHVTQRVRRIVEELVVRLVEDDRDTLAGSRSMNRSMASAVTIVPVGLFGIGDVHLPGTRGEGRQGGVEVLHEARQARAPPPCVRRTTGPSGGKRRTRGRP